MDARVAQWSLRSLIKSIQYVPITLANLNASTNATINAVNTSNAALVWLGSNNVTSSYDPQSAAVILTFTNATTVNGSRVGTAGQATVVGIVLEFQPGVLKSLQYFTIALSSTSGTATLSTAVSVNNTVLFPLGWKITTAAASGELDFVFPQLTLTNTTTVTGTLGALSNAATTTVGGCAVEFF